MTNRWENLPTAPVPDRRTPLDLAILERDHAQAEAQRWARRMTLLEARLEKIRELLGSNPGVESPTEELPGATLSMLREMHRLAPPPFLPMEEWTPEARSAAADFYQVVHSALPALIARAGEQREVYNAGLFEGQLRESALTEEQRAGLRAPQPPLTEEAVTYGQEVVAPRIALNQLRDALSKLIVETSGQGRWGVTTEALIALLGIATSHADETTET